MNNITFRLPKNSENNSRSIVLQLKYYIFYFFIENLDECAFKDLNNLIDLNLSKNKLNEIHLNLFKGLNELTYIDISNNELKQIDSDVFKGLNKLNSVKLNNNHLQSINKLRFSKLPIIW